MRKLASALMLSAFAAGTSAYAAPADILDANKAATGGWDGKKTMTVEYAYSGQGMTGKVTSRDDLSNGYWVDTFAIGPATGANGFDGQHGWGKDPSGTITLQDGGDARQLAVNEGYRRANMWWRSDRGGAVIVDDGQKSDGGVSYDVLTVTPKDGKNFDAWFDTHTHLLSRIVELQGTQISTTTLSDYEATDGAEIAHRALVNIGDTKYDQITTVTAASFGPALEQSAYSAPKVTVADFSIAGGAKETTFPFHLYNNHIYADVSVDGKGPYQFIFDTGGVNLLTPPLATALGLKTEGQMQGNGAGSGHMDVGMTKVASLQLGDAVVKDQVFAVMGIDAMSKIEGVGMPGMVGFETFRRFVTRVDYGNNTLTLIRPDAFDPKDAGTPIAFTFYGNTISAPGAYNGIKGNFTIDTGSRASLSLNGPFVAANHLGSGGNATDMVTGWGIGGPTRGVVLRGSTLELGSVPVHGAVVELSTDKGGAMADAALAGNIGAGVLKRFIVTLDYEHMTMYLKPVTKPVPDLDTFDRAGLWINEDDAGYTVVDVTKDAPAAQAGLKDGDVIVAVDGKPAMSIPLYDMRRQLRDDAAGTVVTFAVKRGSETKDVAVTLRDLI
jgi:membrane-associated protease RseP (regulator of RpoE activity)